MTPEKDHNMSDKQPDPESTSDSDAELKTAPKENTIGRLLKSERERKGISYEKIVEITKLRPEILKTLESESWADLPSPVLAGGFIKAYGHALGLEDKKVMQLFQKSRPILQTEMKPLVPPTKHKRVYVIGFIVFLLALSCGYFLWQGYHSTPQTITLTSGKDMTNKAGSKIEPIEETSPSDSTELQAPEDSVNSSDRNGGLMDGLPLADRSLDKAVTHPQEASIEAISAESADIEMTLSARINETTWVKIYVDDRAPREYIFKPGERFIWKGKSGFEILVGNAAGIDFVLDGESIAIPDSPGKVIRLQLPNGYEREIEQE